MKVNAKVLVTLEVQVSTNWGPESQVQTVFRDAMKSAINIIKDGMPDGIKVIGTPDTPKVIAVMVED